MKSHQLIKKEGYSNDYIFRVVERDMRNISEDDFVTLMRDLLNDVANEYKTMCIESFNERLPEVMDRNRRELMRQYSKKLDAYKRESSRTKLLAEIDEQAKERAEQNRKYLSTGIFWDIMPVCFDNAHPSYTTVTSTSSDYELRLNYKEFKKYIEMSSGIVFKYETTVDETVDKPRYAFRPWIEFIIPDDVMNDLQETKRQIDEKIMEFYNSLRYKGD